MALDSELDAMRELAIARHEQTCPLCTLKDSIEREKDCKHHSH
jgi:hypothetical protein